MNIELYDKARQWGVDVGLTGMNGKGTTQRQFRKFLEETMELFDAIDSSDVKKTRDALGDLQVVGIQAYSINSGFYQIPGCTTDQELRVFFKQPMDFIAKAIGVFKHYPDLSIGLVRDLAEFLGHDPDECLQEAYDVISERTGQMVGDDFIRDK